jgi:hypothetical protein
MKSWWKMLWLRLLYGAPIPQEGDNDVFAKRREELNLPPGRPMKQIGKE